MSIFSLCVVCVCVCVCGRYEKKVYSSWTAEVQATAKINLEKPLLTRNPNNQQLAVNFDPEVGIFSLCN